MKRSKFGFKYISKKLEGNSFKLAKSCTKHKALAHSYRYMCRYMLSGVCVIKIFYD